MSNQETSILFFGKMDHWATDLCLDYLAESGLRLETHVGNRGDAFPDHAGSQGFDYVLSFSSPWIIPESLLRKARATSLNFHPGPPEYPGIGCYNFAIYHEEKTYGATCHVMERRVDSGDIVTVSRFPLTETDSVATLMDKTYHHMHAMFVEIVGRIAQGRDLPVSNETWTREPFTRKQLNDLCRIDFGMDEDEVRRRVRAMDFPGYPGAFIEFHGIRFEARPKKSA